MVGVARERLNASTRNSRSKPKNLRRLLLHWKIAFPSYRMPTLILGICYLILHGHLKVGGKLKSHLFLFAISCKLYTPVPWLLPDHYGRFETFMKFTTTLGVFLHSERLRRSFYTLAPFGSPSRPSPALVSAIYLWGIVISGSPALINYQSVFLSRAIYHSTTSGQTLHPPLTRHTVQAELLITCYLFHIGLGAEGKAHSDAALRLALSENIHKVRGTEIPNLSSLTDSIDLGERMNAAWMSFLTDACISSIHGFPTALPNQDDEQGRIDMPWPLDMAQYDKVINHITT